MCLSYDDVDSLFYVVPVAETWGLLGLRLADDSVLPFNYLPYVDQLQVCIYLQVFFGKFLCLLIEMWSCEICFVFLSLPFRASRSLVIIAALDCRDGNGAEWGQIMLSLPCLRSNNICPVLALSPPVGANWGPIPVICGAPVPPWGKLKRLVILER